MPGGGLASAQDADTDGVEGLTYTWTPEEADGVGLPRELLEPFEHGRFIVRGELDPELRERLLAERDTRPQPFRDDKALASWNGLALAALAEAGYRLERADWLDARARLGEFLLGPLSADDGRLLPLDAATGARAAAASSTTTRTSRTASSSSTSRPGELRWLLEARRLALLAVELFADDEHGGFFLSPADGDARVAAHEGRSRTRRSPRATRCSRYVLLRLVADLGRRRARASRGLASSASSSLRCARAPGCFAWALCGARPLAQPAARDRDRRRRRARRSHAPRWRRSSRRTVVAVGPSEEVPLLAGKSLVDGKPAVYVCERFACQAPVTEPEEVGRRVMRSA